MGENNGSVVGVDRVIDHGPDTDKWTLLVAGDGFTHDELGAFQTAVADFVDYLEDELTGVVTWERVNRALAHAAALVEAPDDVVDDRVVRAFEAALAAIDATASADLRRVTDAARRELRAARGKTLRQAVGGGDPFPRAGS